MHVSYYSNGQFFCLSVAQSWLINLPQCFSSLFVLKGRAWKSRPSRSPGREGCYGKSSWFERYVSKEQQSWGIPEVELSWMQYK